MIVDIIGWIGSVLVLLAYGLNIYKMLASDGVLYCVIEHCCGSGCLIVNTLYHHAMPSAAVNIIWIFIALIALINRDRVIPKHKN